MKTLRVGVEGRALLLEDYRKLPRATDPMSRLWEKWLKGTLPTLQVTFEQEAAVDSPAAVLLSLGHPLLRQAAAYLHESEAVFVKLRASRDTLPEGLHPFALYRWMRQGIRRDEELIPVVANDQVGSVLMDLLPLSSNASDLEEPAQPVLDELDAIHHHQWLIQSTHHAEDNRQLVGVRIQSLTASFGARKAVLEDQIRRATNDKIRVMKAAELERATVDFDVRIAELRRAAESGDIKASPAVFGVIEIRRAG